MDSFSAETNPFRDIVESSDDFIVILDRDRRFLYVNHVAEGLKLEEVVGRQIEDFTPADYRQIAIDAIARVYESGQPDQYETSALGDAGRLAHYLCRISPLMDGDVVHAVSVIATNITSRKEYETKLESLNSDLERRVQERTRTLEERSLQLVTVQEQERKHLAHELHDQVGGLLASMQLELEAALDGSIPERLTGLFDAITRTTRNISGNLRSSALDDFGLEAAISDLLPEQADAADSGLRASFNHDLESGQRFDSAVETVVYRVCQEALANTLRHAEASRFNIRLTHSRDLLELDIQDDGVGFAPEEVTKTDRRTPLGLMGMKDRVRLVGGKFTLQSGENAGTVIKVAMPVGKAAPPATD